ncbi:MAG: tRNA threonylcarbamoyladenosine dehydratase, partial [Coriobacteriia bacterium]|nr:tRNA threonylcarbamoyladenosine dehydratase [Coriobacteriia bacterium]
MMQSNSNNGQSPCDWRSRTALLIGDDSVKTLASKTVAIIGLGGVGAYAAEMIVRAGVGRVIIMDSDVVNITNKNRQLLALESTIGLPKAKLMEQRLKDINPSLKILVIEEFLTEDNVDDLLKVCLKTGGETAPAEGVVVDSAYGADYIVDAIDTLSPKIALINFAVTNSIPLVSSMGAGAKLDATKVKLKDISKSFNCPLAYMIRKRLRKLGISRGFEVVFSEE